MKWEKINLYTHLVFIGYEKTSDGVKRPFNKRQEKIANDLLPIIIGMHKIIQYL
jgi:hypothetical protein